MIDGITLHQLQCFDAVVTAGGFQAAADQLLRSQPTVFSAVKNLENQLGLKLLNRSGYRVGLTDEGRAFHERAQLFLGELRGLKAHAAKLAAGEESELRVVVGDLCPLASTLGLLRGFFDGYPGTRLHLHFEAISGPWERLFDGDADLILHHIDKADVRLEYTDLFGVQLVPVVAPGFLQFAVHDAITPEQMRNYVQCIIRDTAKQPASHDYYLIDGARRWTVADQLMKRELILQGMGWGHMPEFLVAEDLRQGRLLSIAGKHFRGGAVDVVAARRRGVSHGPIASRLWQYIADNAGASALGAAALGGK